MEPTSGADWSIAIGFLVYFIALIVAIIYYVSYRKFSIVLYVASISTLVFSIFYTIDVYDFNRHFILITLVISTIAFYILGQYFKNISYTREEHLSIDQKNNSKKEGKNTKKK